MSPLSSVPRAFTGAYAPQLWRWEKHKKVGWIVLVFSSFSPTEVTGQKQLDYSL